MLKLSDILRAAFSHSQAGRQPQSLKPRSAVRTSDAFDFDALSRIVGKGAPRDELPPARRARLEHTLAVLQSQRFFATAEMLRTTRPRYGFEFDNCAAAAQACRERVAEVAILVKAISIAELEVNGRYVEAEHDLVFDAFDAHSLSADDLARFPDYLVCIPPERNDAAENANLMDMLSSGLPVKVLVQTADLLEDAAIGTGHFAFGVRSARLATAAMGLGGMFVLQSTSSNLPALRHRIARGLECRGPALFSVYAGNPPAPRCRPTWARPLRCNRAPFRPSPTTPPPGATGRRASRCRTTRSPRTTGRSNCPTVDDAQQRTSKRCAFTFADFVLCDPRYAAHFALVPRGRWNDRCCRSPSGWFWTRRRRPACAIPAGGGCRRRVAASDRRCEGDAGHAPLPAAVASAAGARRRARLARRAPAGAREGGLGGRDASQAEAPPPAPPRAAPRPQHPPQPPRPKLPRRRARATRRTSKPRVAPAATNAS